MVIFFLTLTSFSFKEKVRYIFIICNRKFMCYTLDNFKYFILAAKNSKYTCLTKTGKKNFEN